MTPERVNEIYDSLDGLYVELDKDPVARGPAYLQDLISRTRGYLNQTSKYLQEINRAKHSLEDELDAKEAAFEVQRDELLAEDRRVTRMPSVEDRLAMVNLLLAEERREIQRIKREVKGLSNVERVVRQRHKELDNTMSAIRLQKQLVDAELRTGSMYGDENDESRGNRWSSKSAPNDPLDDDEIMTLLQAAEGALEKSSEDDDESGGDTEEATATDESDTEESEDEDDIEDLLDTDEEGSTLEALEAAMDSDKPAADLEAEDVGDDDQDPDITRFLDGDEFFDILEEI